MNQLLLILLVVLGGMACNRSGAEAKVVLPLPAKIEEPVIETVANETISVPEHEPNFIHLVETPVVPVAVSYTPPVEPPAKTPAPAVGRPTFSSYSSCGPGGCSRSGPVRRIFRGGFRR